MTGTRFTLTDKFGRTFTVYERCPLCLVACDNRFHVCAAKEPQLTDALDSTTVR